MATNLSSDVTPAKIEQHVQRRLPGAEWGLSQCRLIITSFAYVKVYRFLSNEYRSLSMPELEQPKL